MQNLLLSLSLFAAVFCGAALLLLRLRPSRARLRLQRLDGLRAAAPGKPLVLDASRRAAAPMFRALRLPLGWTHRSFGARKRRAIAREFPQALDLLVLCLEAGLALDAALARVCEEMERIAPAVTRELSRAVLEMRAGAGRESALRDFAARCGLAEVTACVATLLQAERFGAGVAEALRQHASDLRLRRRMQAEEAAAKLALKLLFPLIFCVFPALLVVLMGPAIIQAGRALLPGLGS
ncbi:type II secretion system F family protein [Noviherbaspirillum pedocola]|uniref:Type II secretion system F family protein n=1 Tax=Noviherbaspirillum pedocola TaxID=2801341 RepID=A0A934SR88_9BURK|nr:type II secretion system F family protein [Noviherbaspirillum pedocola]MBK4733656.1 type II secretion system F family protein [Noviherbaspirillum pedocola]